MTDSRAIWNADDCWTWLAPADASRPRWLRECANDREAVRACIREHGSLLQSYHQFARDLGFVEVEGGHAARRPNDRVLGFDRLVGLTGAVVQPDCTDMLRTPTGHAVAHWRKVVAVFRYL